jgi:glutaminase
MSIPKLFIEHLDSIYHQLIEEKKGQIASYIPELKKSDPDDFAVAFCSTQGDLYQWGHADKSFTIQSVSKPFTYCLAQELLGHEKVHQYVGFEPSGHRFNEMTLDENQKPHNPMVNSGGITCSYLIQEAEKEKALDCVQKLWGNLAQENQLDLKVLDSEKKTGHRNFALAHFLMEQKLFKEDTNIHELTEFYFQICSILQTSKSLASACAVLANGGRDPHSGRRIFAPLTVQHCLSLMLSCGMYDYSGTFAFQVGLPAKSGVSGALICPIPGVGGLAVYSPPLDPYGNSVRALSFCKELARRSKLHVFHQ